MSDKNDQMIRFDNVECIASSDKAALLRFHPPYTKMKFQQLWIPWSVTEGAQVQKVGDKGTIYIQRWMADKINLSYDEDAP